MTTEYHSVIELAQKLGVTKQAIYLAIHEGRIPCEKIGNTFVFREDVFQAVRPYQFGKGKRLKYSPY